MLRSGQRPMSKHPTFALKAVQVQVAKSEQMVLADRDDMMSVTLWTLSSAAFSHD